MLLSRCSVASFHVNISDCSEAYTRRKRAAILASKIAVLYGFVIKASPPSMMLFSSSISVLQLVTKIIGTLEMLRILEQIEKPLSLGNLISSNMRWGSSALKVSVTFEKSFTETAVYPLPRKRVSISPCMTGSSSIISILYGFMF